MARTNIIQDHRGYWHFIRTNEDGEAVGGASDAYSTRVEAEVAVRTMFPQDQIFMDGVTLGAAAAPPLPRVDAAAEARASGVPADIQMDSEHQLDPISEMHKRRATMDAGTV